MNEDDYRKVRLAALPEPSDDHYDYYGGSDEAIMGRGPGADLYYRGHVFHVAVDSDDETGAYEQEEADADQNYDYDHGIDWLAPRNLIPDFDRAAEADEDSLDVSAIAQQALQEIDALAAAAVAN